MSRAEVLDWDLGYSSLYLLRLCWFKQSKWKTYTSCRENPFPTPIQSHSFLPLHLIFQDYSEPGWANRYPAAPKSLYSDQEVGTRGPRAGAYLPALFCTAGKCTWLCARRRVDAACQVSSSVLAVWSKVSWGQDPWDGTACAESNFIPMVKPSYP